MGIKTKAILFEGDPAGRSRFMKLHSYATASLPTATLGTGVLAYDTTTNTVKFSNGTAWANVKNPTYFAQAGGSNNAITITLTDENGASVALADGLRILVDLNSLTLQAGANTVNLNGGGAVNLKSRLNIASNIAGAYSANGFIDLCYNATSTVWMDLGQ